MFKFLTIAIIATSISNLTGIPIFPLSPTISNNKIKFVHIPVNEKKLNDFTKYIESIF